MTQQDLHFDGPDLTAADHHRLTGQLLTITRLMSDRRWYTLKEIEAATGYGQASISAQLRNLRKPDFGSHVVDRDKPAGVNLYRVAA
jgi:hypothetical protein